MDKRTYQDRVKKNPSIRAYHNNWRRQHRMKNLEKYKGIDRQNYLKYSRQNHIKSLGRKFPRAFECELCPENDKRIEKLERHHPSYENGMEGIFVTVCSQCHKWVAT